MAYLNGELVTGFGVNITPVVIDQQFDPTSENPQSGVAIAGALDDYVNTKISKPSAENNDKFPRAKNGDVEWVEQGLPTDEQTETAVTNWLNKHPEATTTVQDGSLTYDKLSLDLKKHVDDKSLSYVIDLKKWDIPNDGTNAVKTTENINSALTWAKNNGYNTVVLPEGTYLIYALNDSMSGRDRRIDAGIKIPSNMNFIMCNETVLRVEPNSSSGYSCFYLGRKNNVTIKGGIVYGDRDAHDYTGDGGGSHEYGYGVYTQGGDNIVIDGVKFYDFTGDCIFFGNLGMISSDGSSSYYDTKNSKIINCTLSNSRRNNISVQACENIEISGNYITNAGADTGVSNGTAPKLGIDIEGFGEGQHDYTVTKNIIIRNNFFDGNVNGDAQLQTGYNCIIEGNVCTGTLSYGCCNNATIANNTMIRSDKQASAISSIRVSLGYDGNNVSITGNSIIGYNNGIVASGKNVVITGNNIYDTNSGIEAFSSDDVSVLSNKIDRCGTGIKLYNATNTRIISCVITNIQSYAIYAYYGSEVSAEITSNALIGCDDTAIFLNVGSTYSIINNIIESSKIGIKFRAGLKNIKISDNTITSETCITCEGGTSAVENKANICGNKIHHSYFGINFTLPMHANIANNIIVWNGTKLRRMSIFVGGLNTSTVFDNTPLVYCITGNTFMTESEIALGNAIYTNESGGKALIVRNVVLDGKISTNTSDIVAENYIKL